MEKQNTNIKSRAFAISKKHTFPEAVYFNARIKKELDFDSNFK